jgi:hypothetical protein
MGLFTVEPQPRETDIAAVAWIRWVGQLRDTLVATTPLAVPSYTLTTLPTASLFSGKYIDVSNATGGAKLCRSDGTNWKIVNTTTTVS